MSVYTEVLNTAQVPLDPVENLGFDDIILADQFWRHREPEHRETIVARCAILFAFEEGAIGATEAIHYLAERDLFGDAEFFMEAFAAGVVALSSRPTLPPTDIPTASPEMRQAPSECLLEVLAKGRAAA